MQKIYVKGKPARSKKLLYNLSFSKNATLFCKVHSVAGVTHFLGISFVVHSIVGVTCRSDFLLPFIVGARSNHASAA